MHRIDLTPWRHLHQYGGDTAAAERRTRIVIGITAAMMVVEIVAGGLCRSMALLADGWHMGTHVSALLLTALAYGFSRRHAADPRYSFGTGKVGALGGFASAVFLVVIALLMAAESIHRLFVPLAIRFNEAIGVAAAGLVVNLACARVLQHRHHDDHGGHQHPEDLNLRSAYVHVLADALTSVTAIIALVAGKFAGWTWLDPAMGLVGGAVVAAWAYGLIRDTSGVLLDRTPAGCDLPGEIHRAVEADGDARVADLHVWQIAPGRFAAAVSVVAEEPQSVEVYRRRLAGHAELVHLTIEVRRCPEHAAPV